ncbi:MAG: nitronate monooxygenase [Bacillota bacterium]
MNKFKTAFVLLLALTLCLGVFAGCGAKPVEQSEAPSDAPESETPAADDLAYINGNGKMIIGYTVYEPMNYTDEKGEFTGFDTEFAKAVCEKLGVTPEFVEIEGREAGGHLGFPEEELRSGSAQTLEEILPQVLEELIPYEEKYGRSIPVFVAGGGLGGADLVRFRKLGAAGVQIATRLIATQECDASQAFKDVIVGAGAEDVRIIHSPVGMPGRAVATPLVRRMELGERLAPRWCAGCIKHCDPATTHYCITHALIEAVKGNVEEGLFFCGAGVDRVNQITTVAQVLEEFRLALEEE